MIAHMFDAHRIATKVNKSRCASEFGKWFNSMQNQRGSRFLKYDIKAFYSSVKL